MSNEDLNKRAALPTILPTRILFIIRSHSVRLESGHIWYQKSTSHRLPLRKGGVPVLRERRAGIIGRSNPRPSLDFLHNKPILMVGEGPTPCQMLDNGADQDGETRGQGSVLGTMASPGFRESHIVKLDKLLTRWMFMNARRKQLKALMFLSPLRVVVSWKPWDPFTEPCLRTTDLRA
uniref:Uncharacterized protein n=1 Tax=Timema poppense TaxID=170557 RepID=A0A7R9CV14_TIMPO|nr:unnamed protein product [Timema poppensis]